MKQRDKYIVPRAKDYRFKILSIFVSSSNVSLQKNMLVPNWHHSTLKPARPMRHIKRLLRVRVLLQCNQLT
jgi:hypothetical protein